MQSEVRMQEFERESLARYNGRDGKPAYVACQGKVYDVSASRMWKAGAHMKRHAAGQDLSRDILAAPHGVEKLESMPQVGIFKEAAFQEQALPPFLEAFLKRYPFFRRHPHPSLVHFPIAFLVAPAVFNCLFLITGLVGFETTAFYCLGAGILCAVPAIFTGYFTWWINYQARPMRPVHIKIGLSWLLFLIAIPAFMVRLIHPGLRYDTEVRYVGYLLATFMLAAMVGAIGWYGGGLTIPLEKPERSRL